MVKATNVKNIYIVKVPTFFLQVRVFCFKRCYFNMFSRLIYASIDDMYILLGFLLISYQISNSQEMVAFTFYVDKEE